MAVKKTRKTNSPSQVFIKKSNRLNNALMYANQSNTAYPISCSYDGYRLWLIAAALFQKTGNPEFTITFDEYAKTIGIARPRVENICNSLNLILSCRLLVSSEEKPTALTIINLFCRFTIDTGEKCITGKLNQECLEMLDNKIAERFTMISLQSVNNCKRSLCATRLYELCKQNAYKGKLRYENIQLFLAAVGYDKQDFEIRILDKWVSIVNSGTDVFISYAITRGEKNRIKGVEFTISANSTKPMPETNEADEKGRGGATVAFDKKMLLSDLLGECRSKGITLEQKDAEEIIETAYEVIPEKLIPNVTGELFDANREKRSWRILSNIKYLAQTIQAGKRITSTTAWIKAAIQKDFANDPL